MRVVSLVLSTVKSTARCTARYTVICLCLSYLYRRSDSLHQLEDVVYALQMRVGNRGQFCSTAVLLAGISYLVKVYGIAATDPGQPG